VDRKILYLGFQKCGTTSFFEFFAAHGFKVIHNALQACDAIGLPRNVPKGFDLLSSIDINKLDKFVEKFDVFTDNPFPLLYTYFDRRPENNLFVLGTRPADQWITSMQRYFGTRMPALGGAIYASDANPCSDPNAFMKTYEMHNSAVRKYFKGRNDFIEIQLGTESNATITRRIEEFVKLPKKTGYKFGTYHPK